MQALRERRPHRSVTDNTPSSPQFHRPFQIKHSQSSGTSIFTRSNVCITVQFILNLVLLLLLFPTADRHDNNTLPKGSESPLPNRFDVYVTVYAYDRPKHLLNLLRDIAHEADAAHLSVGVNVIDDNSYACTFSPVSRNIFQNPSSPHLKNNNSLGDSDILYQVPLPNTLPSCTASHRFAHVERFVHSRGWRIFVSPFRHGRRRYWHLICLAHTLLLHSPRADYYLFLPDDDRLPSNFFPSVVKAWHSISDTRKLTLMLHVEQTREHTAVWTDLKPIPISSNLTRIGWVESGNFLCTSDLLEFLNWSFPYIPPRRWLDNPPISSGVGATLSQLIHSSGHFMYRTDTSYVAHVGVTLSKMNAAFRDPHVEALRTKYFADGDQAYELLLAETATVTVSMASHWVREVSMQAAVHSLSSQVDHLNVFLNGYDHVPTFLLVPFVTVKTSSENGADLGDVGKFYWANEVTTEFHATVDDDIVYPPDYIDQLLKFRRSLRAPVVVGVHGIRIREDWLRPEVAANGKRRGRGYYGSREVWMGTEEVKEAVNVHIIGTGTMVYKVSEVGEINMKEVFPKPNMADVWFGLLAQRLQLPMMVMPHKKGWVAEVDGTFDDSIYKRASRRRSADREQTRAALSIPQWHLNEGGIRI